MRNDNGAALHSSLGEDRFGKSEIEKDGRFVAIADTDVFGGNIAVQNLRAVNEFQGVQERVGKPVEFCLRRSRARSFSQSSRSLPSIYSRTI